ncbi:MAG TPA: hypothetical protein PKA64_07245 [Myxococcota bacterium]|nr:hypothetical protein [Myxococcota bacterium]
MDELVQHRRWSSAFQSDENSTCMSQLMHVPCSRRHSITPLYSWAVSTIQRNTAQAECQFRPVASNPYPWSGRATSSHRSLIFRLTRSSGESK